MSGKKRKMSEDPETMRYMSLYENEQIKDRMEEAKKALNSSLNSLNLLEQAREKMFKVQEVTTL